MLNIIGYTIIVFLVIMIPIIFYRIIKSEIKADKIIRMKQKIYNKQRGYEEH